MVRNLVSKHFERKQVGPAGRGRKDGRSNARRYENSIMDYSGSHDGSNLAEGVGLGRPCYVNEGQQVDHQLADWLMVNKKGEDHGLYRN